MPGLFVRLLMVIAAPIAAWFVGRDALNFPVVQMVVAIGLFTLLAAALAFAPLLKRWKHKKKMRQQEGETNVR